MPFPIENQYRCGLNISETLETVKNGKDGKNALLLLDRLVELSGGKA